MLVILSVYVELNEYRIPARITRHKNDPNKKNTHIKAYTGKTTETRLPPKLHFASKFDDFPQSCGPKPTPDAGANNNPTMVDMAYGLTIHTYDDYMYV